MQTPEIVTKPELTVIGMRAAFIHALSPDATNFEVIGPLWQRFIDRADSVPNRIGNSMYGIVYGEPEDERSHPDEPLPLQAVTLGPDSAPVQHPADPHA